MLWRPAQDNEPQGCRVAVLLVIFSTESCCAFVLVRVSLLKGEFEHLYSGWKLFWRPNFYYSVIRKWCQVDEDVWLII